MEIRDLTDADVETVLALNAANVKMLSPMDADLLARFRDEADAIRIAEIDGQVAGFCILYSPDSSYRGINFRWFRDQFSDFLYLDRIAVAEDFQRRGVATALYDQAEQRAEPHGRLVAEVNFNPPNEASLAFHEARGFVEIGTLSQPGGTVCVMLEKTLPAA